MKKWHKFPLLILAVTLVLGGCYYLNFGTFTSHSISRYEELLDNVPCLPALGELGTVDGYDYVYRDKRMFIFYCESHMLTVQYDSENYDSEKARLDETYAFESEMLGNQFSEEQLEPWFLLDGYSFRVLSMSHYDMEMFPHEFVLIGTNDTKHEIVYLYTYDPDLDSLSSFPEYLNEYCGWGA